MKQVLLNKDYKEALKENRILGMKCRSCGLVTSPPKMLCPGCAGDDLEVVELKTEGVIRTFTTVYVAAEGRESELPYIIVIVETADGPWVMGNLDCIDPKEASMDIVGKPVKMTGTRIFEGDPYSAGEGVRAIFELA